MALIVPIAPIVALLLLGSPKPPAPHAPPGPRDGTGRLLARQGIVQLRRPTWARRQFAGTGTELHAGDTIEVPTGGSALVLCPDLKTTWRPLPGEVSGVFQGCPAGVIKPLTRLGHEGLGIRDPGVAGAPLVLSPSGTALLDPLPWIRWQGVPGVAAFKVSLFDSRSPWRPLWGPALVAGTETEIRYSGRPPLEPGVEYFVRVEVEGGVGAMAQGLPFHLLLEKERQEIAARRLAFVGTIQDSAARAMAVASFLASRELRSDALETLADLAGETADAAVHLLRATLLDSMGEAGAVTAYRQALAMASRQGDREVEAEASLGLARRTRERTEQVVLYERAVRAFRDLGDDTRAAAVEREAKLAPTPHPEQL